MNRVLGDCRGPELIREQPFSDLEEPIYDWHHTEVDPSAVDGVAFSIGVRNTDGNDGGVGSFVVVEGNCDNCHCRPSRLKKFLKVLSRPRVVAAYRIEGKSPLMQKNTTQIEGQSRGMNGLAHDEQHTRLEAKLKRELGETVLELLADDRTEDIVLNPDSALWVKRMGEGFQCIGEMPPAQAASALNTIAAWKGTVMNHERPVLETELPLDGSRFEGIVSPVVRRPVFAIRLRPKRIFSLDEYERSGILTRKDDPRNRLRKRDTFIEDVRGLSHAEIIRAAVAGKRNIL